MSFHQLASQRCCRFQKRTGELAQPSAVGGDYAAFANFAPANKAAPPPGRTHLFPETEGLARSENTMVDVPACKTKVLDLSQNQVTLARIRAVMERRDRLGQYKRKLFRGAFLQTRKRS